MDFQKSTFQEIARATAQLKFQLVDLETKSVPLQKLSIKVSCQTLFVLCWRGTQWALRNACARLCYYKMQRA
jgi:hypothetical protein